MNKNACLLIALSCLLAMLISCSKDIHSPTLPSVSCPSFDDPLFIEWFPYKNAQIMIFKNDSGATDTISIGSVNISGAYTKLSSTFTADSCKSSATIVSNERVDTSYLKLLINDYTSALGQDSVLFYMYGFTFTCGPVSDTGLDLRNVGPKIYSSTYTNYSFNGKIYNKVQVITQLDTIITNTYIPWIYKVFISQNTGIIGYETFPQKQIWALQ